MTSKSDNDSQKLSEICCSLIASLCSGDLLVAVFNANNVLVYANPTFKDAYKLRDVDRRIIFTDLFGQVTKGHYEQYIETDSLIERIGKKRAGRLASAERGFANEVKDGRWFWITKTVLENGWITVVGADFSLQKKAEKGIRLARDAAFIESRTDALTGLPNRRHALEVLETTLRVFVKREAPASAAMIDLDHFKRINDVYGHPAGDVVLRDFARICKEVLRREDLVGRIGGEEFLVVLPGAPLSDAFTVLSRLRKRVIDQTVVIGPSQELRYAFSAGTTPLIATDTAQDVLDRADCALYAAKQAGRNRICGYEG